MNANKSNFIFSVEHTDTFGGEANYSWVNRYELEVPSDLSNREISKRAKALCGLTGVPCKREMFGDGFALYPRGYNQVIFVSFEEEIL